MTPKVSKLTMTRGARPFPRGLPFIVYSIGHSSRTLEDFLDLLKAHEIERVADIRSIPRSRRNPQFNRESLAKTLRNKRIGYVHLAKLGGLRHARKDSPNTGWRNASFRGFADYMQTPGFQEGLSRLLTLAKAKRTAMMCAEAVPWRCHRSLVSDALLVRGVHVEHIMSGKRRQVHNLTSFAKVKGKKIMYPPLTPPAELGNRSLPSPAPRSPASGKLRRLLRK